MATWLQLWLYRRFREHSRKNRKSPNYYKTRPGLRRRGRTKHASSYGRIVMNELQKQTKHHTRCRTIQNTVTKNTAGYTIGTKKPTTTDASHTISLKTPNTTTGHTTDGMMHAATPILTATMTKAITITRTRHLAQTMMRTLSTENPNRDVRIYTNGPNSEWPEPMRAHPRSLAHIPIPATQHGNPQESVTNVPTAQREANVYEANTYEQLWPLFEFGMITILDTFTRLYLMD